MLIRSKGVETGQEERRSSNFDARQMEMDVRSVKSYFSSNRILHKRAHRKHPIFFAQLCLVRVICQSKALIYDCAFGLGTRCKFAAVAMKSMTLRFGQGPKSAIESQLQCNWLLTD